MRWRFSIPLSPNDAAERSQKIELIDAWWKAFASRKDDLETLFKGGTKWDLPEWMGKNLAVIDRRLMWEFGPGVCGAEHRLVITPENCPELRPMVDVILTRAPVIPGWEFYPYRPAESVETAARMVKGRTGGGIDGMIFDASVGPFDSIDLLFRSPGCQRADDEAASSVAFVAVECLLGEEILDKWIGDIQVAPARRESEKRPRPSGSRPEDSGTQSAPLPIQQLKPTVDDIIRQIRQQLPDRPLHVQDTTGDSAAGETTIGALFEIETPEDRRLACEKAGYPGCSDLFLASATSQELWAALHGAPKFYSCRFSRHGETFCYIKMDGREESVGCEFEDRAGIEEALNDVLVPAAAGCTVSGGTGYWYSYIDLALSDVDRGIQIIRERLAGSNLSHRSWIHFFDLDLLDEWVGIYDDTPPPPGFEPGFEDEES